MGISGVLWRFFAAYIGLIVLVAVGFNLAGAKPNAGINAGVLIGAVFWPCLAFAEKNGRYFTPPEKTRVIWSMIGIDVLLQLLVAVPALAGAQSLSAGALLVAFALVIPLHAAVIYFAVGYAGKLFDKQQARKLAKE